jgi:UDP-N-acetyl-D-mannosaminuronic acid dehydrogenase
MIPRVRRNRDYDYPVSNKIVVVGGCGHVGLPLAMAFADRGCNVISYDINPVAVATVNSGVMPFLEPDADQVMKRIMAAGTFQASTDPGVISDADVLIVVVGTPVDEHLNPDAEAVPNAVAALGPYLRDDQLLILRSTVYPGVTRLVERRLAQLGHSVDIAFCPERIAEGKAFTELYDLPQIVSGCSDTAIERASEVFGLLTEQIVVTSPEEAELAKLFTNTWRYIKFAAANQFYMIANDYGIDFENVRHAITHDYPRALDMPGPGFAAGPCLFKDTMQLAAFNNNNFTLGHASMMVNEGLPLYLVSKMEQKFDLPKLTIGILGMAFKSESDDIRSSLSYKLRRILRFKASDVLCTDPFVTDDQSLLSFEEVVDRSDVLVIGAPHSAYRTFSTSKPVIDVWNLLGNGTVV